MSSCAGCGAASPPEAKFCGVCGRPQGAVAGVAAPQMPPATAPPMPMPQMPQMTRGFSSGGTGGQTKQALLAGAPQDVYGHVVRTITAKGGEVLWEQQPHAAKLLVARKSFWATAGTTLKYDGDLQLAPAGPAQTSARLSLKLQWGSAVPLLVMQVASVFIASMFSYYVAAFALIILIATLSYTAWSASSGLPAKTLEEIVAALQSAAPPPAAPAAQAFAAPGPAAAPAPMTAQPAPAPPSRGGGDAAAIAEQIKQLAALRDVGAISIEDFEAKKKDLLSRI